MSKRQEFEAEEIYKHIDKFTSIYENGKEVNPVPNDKKCTVWCKASDPSNSGFAVNVTADELGLEALIANKWILEDDIQRLCGG